MDKILEFIELQDTISYNQSFDLAEVFKIDSEWNRRRVGNGS